MSERNKHIDYNRIAKLLSGQDMTGNFEFAEQEMDNCKQTWKLLDEMQEIEKFDTDKAWDNLFSRFDNEGLIEDEKETKVRKITPGKWISIAASIVILIGVFTTFILSDNWFDSSMVLIENKSQIPQLHKLPDGSEVHLNYCATLKYSKKFSEDNRQVELEGEAFFDIERDERHPFEIMVSDAKIKVLGTSFNVNSSETGVEVIVKSGKVQLSNKSELRKLILEKGDRGLYSETELKREINNRSNYLSWLDHQLVFKAVPLNLVVDDINKAFHCTIELKDTNLNNLLITTNFTNSSLDEVLESIALAFNLNIERTGKKYILEQN